MALTKSANATNFFFMGLIFNINILNWGVCMFDGFKTERINRDANIVRSMIFRR
ncbi:MAG: hypothetical protein JWQ54_2140 [Mucilaginibacter sp.]|nr:hypothetical protein [Mucilaginibacter sp.]